VTKRGTAHTWCSLGCSVLKASSKKYHIISPCEHYKTISALLQPLSRCHKASLKNENRFVKKESRLAQICNQINESIAWSCSAIVKLRSWFPKTNPKEGVREHYFPCIKITFGAIGVERTALQTIRFNNQYHRACELCGICRLNTVKKLLKTQITPHCTTWELCWKNKVV
jgi:hypothetical protein